MEVKGIFSIEEMKRILAKKLKDEESCFAEEDISIERTKESEYRILIKGYEHIPFKMSLETDEYFGYVVLIKDPDMSICEEIFVDNQNKYDIETALAELGYYIGTSF